MGALKAKDRMGVEKVTKTNILILIAAFITLTLGSFIWFIATWDADNEQPIGLLAPASIERATL